MQGKPVQENKMGYMPVGKLLLSMALPMALSMLVQALYNIVDSMYVSQISEAALTAVTLAFPIQNFMIAVASGTAVGVNALLSRSLGQREFGEANRAALNGVFLAIVSMLAFVAFGLLGSRAFYLSQTADPVLIEYGTQYLTIVSAVSIGIFGEIMFERLLQSTGKTMFAMISQLVGAITNIILDPIMIFGLYGCPKMGVAGAAWATVIGQILAMALAIAFNLLHNHELTLKLKGFRPNLRTIKTIYAVGLPSILMMSIGSVMTYGLNKILIAFTPTAAAVFGVYFKLQSFVFMPVFGLNNGMVPIIAYNYGARNKARIVRTMFLSMVSATVLMVVGFTVFQVLTTQLLSLFNASEDMLAIGVPSLRIISYSFIFAGFCIVAGSVFQALGNGVYSLIVSITRQLVVLLPVAYLFSLTGILDAVWYAFPIAELFSLTLSILFLQRIYRQKIKPLDTPA
ncbi:MAG: MATE family efflux transporter [Clostridia bacterium]